MSVSLSSNFIHTTDLPVAASHMNVG